MSHLLQQKDDVKGGAGGGGGGAVIGIQKALSGKPGSSNGGAGGDRSAVKKNLNLAVEIVSRCFSGQAPKSV